MKVPKSHPQLNLPVGTRIRFALGNRCQSFDQDHLYFGSIVDGIPLAPGLYWVRRQHSFKPFKLKAKAIKFILFHPTAPACPPARKPLIPCPTPMTAVDASGRMMPIAPRLYRGGAAANAIVQTPALMIPPPPARPAPAIIHHHIPAPAPTGDPTRALRTYWSLTNFERLLDAGEFDDELEGLTAAIWKRTKLARARAKVVAAASLKPGDRVRICGKLKPSWIIGTTGVVKEVGTTKVDVTFDKPVPRFGKGAKIPANCLEKI